MFPQPAARDGKLKASLVLGRGVSATRPKPTLNHPSGFWKSVISFGMGRPSGSVYLGRNAMEWFSGKTSIAGNQISNWVLILAAVVVIWGIYSFAVR